MLVLQGLIDGILAGGLYALMATGVTLVYGVMEVINIAQAILVIVGAYLSYTLASNLHIDPFATLLITVPVLFAIGVVLYVILLRPIKRERVTMSLLMMFAAAILIEGVLDLAFTSNLVEIQAPYANSSLKLGSLTFPVIYLYALAMSIVVLAGLYWMLYRTRFGKSLRAAIQNPVAARIVGINTDRVAAITMGLGASLAALGGMIYGATNAFNAASSYDLISRLLVIVILGGFGSVSGALLASVVMLVVQDVVAVVWSPVWGQTVFYLILFVVLLVRPEGLRGSRAVRAQ